MSTKQISPSVAEASPPGARRIRPWATVVGVGMTIGVAPAALGMSTLGIFVVAITADTGWGRTTVTGGFTFAAIAMMIGFIVVARIADRVAVRWLVIPSFVLFLAGVAMLGFAPPSIPLWLGAWVWLGFFGAGTTIPLARATFSWFDNKRGLAVGLTAAIGGIGATVWPLVASSFISSVGWRLGYLLLALCGLLVSMFALLVLVRVRGERHKRGRILTEVVEDGEQVNLELPGLTLRQALRGRHFWLILFGLNVSALAIVGIQIHLVPMMMDRGMGGLEAASLLSVLGFGGIIGRILGGVLLDRIHGTFVGAGVLLISAFGILILDEPYWLAAVAVFLFGFAVGVEGDLSYFFTSRYLGMRSLGRFLSVFGIFNTLMAAFGPLMLGIAYDLTGSYGGFIPVLIATLVIAAILILLLGRYTYPAITGFDKLAVLDELAAAEVLSEEAVQEDIQRERARAERHGGAVAAGEAGGAGVHGTP
ncbi:MFS transporter [Microbacterium sp. LWS13-1.2]|uniref:MFS transporter n=1 Tax=Microbacterium sp. LWS13-1.2 TaxID=3135264 RepID=A0AAU6SBH6_9MICO